MNEMEVQNQFKRKATTGVVWAALNKYTVTFVSFVSGIILARLLSPDDYGCIGMLTIFLYVGETFVDGGFGSALIQKKRPTQDDYSTVFFFNIFVALVVYLALYLLAPVVAKFYRMPLLDNVLRVQGLVLFFYALSIIQINQLRKSLNFKKIAIISIVSSLLSLSITVFLAYKGFGVWSLVAQNLLMAGIPMALFWITSRWWPKFVFSRASFKELFGFGLYMFLTHLVNVIANNLQGLLVGRIYNPSTMGYFSKASRTEQLASKSLSDVLTQVSYPVYSEYQDDNARLIDVIKKLTVRIAFAVFPMMFILILLAKPLFVLLYSDKWLPSVPLFQMLCLAGLAQCLQSVNLQAIAAIGKSKKMFEWNLVKRIVGISFIVAGLLLFGMNGLMIGMILNAWFAYYINTMLVSKFIGYSQREQCLNLLPILLISLLSLLVSWLVGRWLSMGLYPSALIQLTVFLLVYFGSAALLHLDSFAFFKNVIISVFRRIQKKYY